MSSGSAASKVSEVFAAASKAFNQLGDLAMQLHIQNEAIPGSKWTDEEVDLLRKAVQKFGNDLEKVTAAVKTRTMSQVKHAIKRKVYSEAGMPLGKQIPKSQQNAKKRPASTPQSNLKSTSQLAFNTPSTPVPAKMPKLSESPQVDYSEEVSIQESEVPASAIITEHVVTDSIVDVENLDDSVKKLDQFINSHPVNGVMAGGVSEAAVSNPPPLPPLDFVSEQT